MRLNLAILSAHTAALHKTADISLNQQLPPFRTHDSWAGSKSLFPVLGPHSCVARTALACGSVCELKEGGQLKAWPN